MRFEEKLVEGADLALDEKQRADHLRDQHHDLTELASDEVVDKDRAREALLLTTIQGIFDERTIYPEQLGLPAREQHALAALQAAVLGRDVRRGSFMFADDRRDLLEQALAVLQPSLLHSTAREADALRDQYDRIVAEVGELRDQLTGLADAQDELLVSDRAAVKAEGGDDGDEEDAPPAEASTDADAAKPAAKPRRKAPPAEADAADDGEPPPWTTTLTGAELAVAPALPSSLGDPPEPTEPTPTPTPTPGSPKARGDRRG
jgi:hypothetical protein